MIKEAKGYGATIDEAKENAIANLGASELDDIQFEIITMPKKKVLGIFGGCDAEIRAYIEVADKKPKNSKKPAPAKQQAKKEKPAKAEPEKKAAPAQAEVKKTEPTESAPKAEDEYSAPVDASEVAADSPAGKAIAYIRTVLAQVGCEEVDIKVQHRENGSRISLNGDNLNVIIGRRGETLDALQYLACLAANNGGGHYRISLNTGNYRERREETLTNLARRISAQVLKTGKSRTLEPMNPYERRIIHTAVQNIEGVVSNSFGDGVGRRVVISPEGVEVRPPRNNNDRRRGGNRSRSSRPAQKPPVAPAREPKRDSDTPLYGKIN